MTQTQPCSTGDLWARFRFSVVGSLLSSPPKRGTLGSAIRKLAEKIWSHPVTGRDFHVAAGTIACWYYTALRQSGDPVGALRRALRKDCGSISLTPAIAERLHLQYRNHPDWSYQLHYDNLAALLKADPSLGQLRSLSPPSAATCRLTTWRAGLGSGDALVKRVRRRSVKRKEIRSSHEAEYVGALWHLDFHHGSKKVLTPGGQWQRLRSRWEFSDDHSRLCCHVQWYLSETACDLVHELSQAIQKRGLPQCS